MRRSPVKNAETNVEIKKTAWVVNNWYLCQRQVNLNKKKEKQVFKDQTTFGACIEKSRLKHSQIGVCQRVFNVNLHAKATVRTHVRQRN